MNIVELRKLKRDVHKANKIAKICILDTQTAIRLLDYIEKLRAVAEAAKELNEYDGHYADIDGKLFNNLSLAIAAIEDEK